MLNYVSISLSFAYSFLFLLFVEMQSFLQDLSSINYLVKKISPNLPKQPPNATAFLIDPVNREATHNAEHVFI